MRERDIEAHLVERVRELGGEAYKFVSPARRNVPDRLVLLPVGRRAAGDPDFSPIEYIFGQCVLFVEIKAPGKKPSDGQLREHQRLRALGFRVEVVDTKHGVDQLLETLK
jgi:hypothetical protein